MDTFKTLGDMLLKRYVTNFISQVQQSDPLYHSLLGATGRGRVLENVQMGSKIEVIQLHRRTYSYTHSGYITEKAGKEYWVPILDSVYGCRRGKTRWSFGHKCYEEKRVCAEMRSGRCDDTYMQCCTCGKRFPPRAELTEKANKQYPDLETIKFLAGLDRMNQGQDEDY